MPAGPRVSPTLRSTPYFLGISMSCRQTSVLPVRMVVRTTSAPWSAWRRSRRGLHSSRVAAGGDEFLHVLPGPRQALGIDVHERDGGVLQQGKRKDVAHQLVREFEAAGSDKCDFGHVSLRAKL